MAAAGPALRFTEVASTVVAIVSCRGGCQRPADLPGQATRNSQDGWPAPVSDVRYRGRRVEGTIVFGVTPEYQAVQDYRFHSGVPLAESDGRERRQVA